MPKLLTWRDEWSLGIDALDQDHRMLIDRFADICVRFCPEASRGRSGNAYALLESLSDFGEQVRAHFQREEDFMRAYDYEGIGLQRCEHAILMAEFTEMLRDWRLEGLHVFDDTAQSMVRDWLLAHVLGADRDFVTTYFKLIGSDDSAESRRAFAQLQSSYRSNLHK